MNCESINCTRIVFLNQLRQASALELDFLREVDARGDLYMKDVVHKAVYRFHILSYFFKSLMSACKSVCLSDFLSVST